MSSPTGRLSRAPAIQNIPIRTPEVHQIREALLRKRETNMKIAPLDELDLKDGDVVECVINGEFTDYYTPGRQYILGGRDDTGAIVEGDEDHRFGSFHIVSRRAEVEKAEQDALRERVAKAIAKSQHVDWDEASPVDRADYLVDADAAIAAMEKVDD